MAIGGWFGRWLVPATTAALLFAQAGRAAAAYRDRLEASFAHQPVYTEQSLALGLRIVPVLAVLGGAAAAVLVLSEVARVVGGRRGASSPVAPSAS